jgi:hypothetical protein
VIKIYESSFAAIAAILNGKFPSITNVYLNKLPAEFTRPGFLVRLIKGCSEDCSRDRYRNKITWQLVYYSPQDQEGDIDLTDQLSIAARLQQELMDIMTLTAPDGTQYHIFNLAIELRDNELYCLLDLETLNTRAEIQYDLMQNIYNDYKEG